MQTVMTRRLLGAITLAAALVATACAGGSSPSARGSLAPEAAPETTTTEQAQPTVAAAAGVTVRRVVDGDTLQLTDGRTIRLAQVDAPETNQCFGSEATAALRALAPEGATVTLRRPDDAPKTDRYGRTLAEIYVGEASVDEALIRDGAAEWYEQYAHEDADLARRLQAAEDEARSADRGLWSACHRPAPSPTTTAAPTGTPDCDPSYPDFCLPPSSPDLNCADVPYRDFRVVPPDPHGFDGDGDGAGCET